MTNLSTTSLSTDSGKKEISDIEINSETHFGNEVTERNTISSSSTLITDPQSLTTTHQLPEPSMRIRYGVHWFRIGFSIFVLLSMLLTLVGCSLNAATVNWNKAVNLVPAPVLEQVIAENTKLNAKASVKNILAWNVAVTDGNFTLFNFNNPEVCGVLGCLYAGYWFKQNQPIIRVFLSYLNPNLPPGKQLLAVGDKRNQPLPCLKVLQTEKQQLRQFNYCFNGNHYQVADSQLFSNGNKFQR
ncbi:hypothetical protein B6N60_04934 [Richelia sinica FACHB-800]|uniref:Uncharacterized protein n=1 Tax=Richelia sinica FACHB-800 TaxID=1357546 RepID=A0A975Y7D0_9NOST|nr:hypothetical protein [Richelia sinica]MBD2666930.1 hypothetical protein [Richelia sinica FACHB-800]QXE26203.1 hypothetical protein B6N60_04934 [Richelia sinica FACHB-800]